MDHEKKRQCRKIFCFSWDSSWITGKIHVSTEDEAIFGRIEAPCDADIHHHDSFLDHVLAEQIAQLRNAFLTKANSRKKKKICFEKEKKNFVSKKKKNFVSRKKNFVSRKKKNLFRKKKKFCFEKEKKILFREKKKFFFKKKKFVLRRKNFVLGKKNIYRFDQTGFPDRCDQNVGHANEFPHFLFRRVAVADRSRGVTCKSTPYYRLWWRTKKEISGQKIEKQIRLNQSIDRSIDRQY